MLPEVRTSHLYQERAQANMLREFVAKSIDFVSFLVLTPTENPQYDFKEIEESTDFGLFLKGIQKVGI